MNVLAFKLITGEEILARVNSSKEQAGQIVSYNIDSPMTLMVGQGGLGLIPWALANPQGEFNLPTSAILLAFSPDPEIEKQFMQRTSKIAFA